MNSMEVLGTDWFDDLLKQRPRWVRGTATPLTILSTANYTQSVTFTSFGGFNPGKNVKVGFPNDANFVSWPQTAAILKNAPHLESAKLFHNYLLSSEYQHTVSWSVLQGINPSNSSYPDIMHMPHTNPTAFARFMKDRATVERLRFFFESRLGTAQGLSPLDDDI
jgi:spermidine/putrescine-binding protein